MGAGINCVSKSERMEIRVPRIIEENNDVKVKISKTSLATL